MTFVCKYMLGHSCSKVRGVCGVSLAAFPFLESKGGGGGHASLSLFSVHRRAHIQTAALNRFLANTSCVDRSAELPILLQLAEGTESGRRSKRAATVGSHKAGRLVAAASANTHKHACTE